MVVGGDMHGWRMVERYEGYQIWIRAEKPTKYSYSLVVIPTRTMSIAIPGKQRCTGFPTEAAAVTAAMEEVAKRHRARKGTPAN